MVRAETLSVFASDHATAGYEELTSSQAGLQELVPGSLLGCFLLAAQIRKQRPRLAVVAPQNAGSITFPATILASLCTSHATEETHVVAEHTDDPEREVMAWLNKFFCPAESFPCAKRDGSEAAAADESSRALLRPPHLPAAGVCLQPPAPGRSQDPPVRAPRSWQCTAGIYPAFKISQWHL